MVNVIFLKGPDVFAEFGRVSVFCVLEQYGVVSVSNRKVVFCKSDVCLSGGVVWRQFPLSGHLIFCWQLQVLVSFVLVLSMVSLMCLNEFKMHLLWLSMICLVLFMQRWC